MIPHAICFVKLYFQRSTIFRFANTHSKMSVAKALTILDFCGNISLVEKMMLATDCIASVGFLSQQQKVSHEKIFPQEVEIQKF